MVVTKGIMENVIMAACEWFLMFWMFVEAALAYSLTKFAKRCHLQIPCLLCSRLDHFFGNGEHGMDLLCKKHKRGISDLIYCNLHNELVDVREMCEDCCNSACLQTRSNMEGYRFTGGQRSNLNKSFVNDHCSCCKSQWKERSSNQQPIWSNVVASRASKATTKPPLPRVGRHGRSKRLKNRVKHRHRDLSPVGQYPGIKFTSDSEFEIIYSDNDDGGYKVVGISDRSAKNDTNGGVNKYKILGRHSRSTPDLRSALILEAQLNERSRARSRARSASLTPNSLFRFNMAEMNQKPEVFDPLRIGKDNNRPSSTNSRTHGSLDGCSIFSGSNIGSQNGYKVYSRHSISAADLIRSEMHNINRSRQRSASLTPNSLYRHGLGEYQLQKKAPPKVKKYKKVSNGYRHLDDSAVSRNTANRYNRSRIPRRHSYSVFQLGGDILLNMPTDESQNGSTSYGWEEYRKPNLQSPEPDFLNLIQFPPKENEDYIPLPLINLFRGDLPLHIIDKSKGYGSFDDSVVIRNTGVRYHNSIPRRHSHSFFEFGRDNPQNMPVNEILTNGSVSFAPRGSTGYGLEQQQNNINIQTRPNTSVNSVKVSRRKNKRSKRNKKSNKSSNRTNGYESLDEANVSFNTGVYDRNKDPRRHSYSAFELGCALLLNGQPIDESLTTRPASITRNLVIEPKRPKLQTMQNPYPSSPMYLNKNQGYGFLDDSVVSFNTGTYDRNNNPRRYSYSAFELGCALLANSKPIDKSLQNSSASMTQNGAISYGFEEPKRPVFQTRHNPIPSPAPMFLNKNQGYGFMDDSVVSFNNGYDRKIDPRRHSYSAFELGDALLFSAQPDNSLITPTLVTRNDAINHGFGEPKMPVFQMRGDPSHSTMFFNKNQGYGFVDDSVFSFNTGIYDRNNDPRRHSYSAFELGCALMNEQPINKSLPNSFASVPRNAVIDHGFGEPSMSGFQTRPSSSHSIKFLNKNLGYGFSDDSVVALKRMDDHSHHHNQNKLPRRHSYSILQLGGDIILNMPHDESLACHSLSLAPNNSTSQSSGDLQNFNFQNVERDMKYAAPTGSVKRFSPSYDAGSDLQIDKTKWHGSFDDYLISRSMGSQSQSNIPRRYSHSALDLGRALLLEINLDNTLKNSHGSTGHANEEHNRAHHHHHKAKRHKNHLPPTCPTIPSGPSSDFRNDIFTIPLDRTHGRQSLDGSFYSQKTGNRNQNNDSNPRRHSYSAFEIGCGLLLNMQRDPSLTRRSTSVTPKVQTVNQTQHLNLKKNDQLNGSKAFDDSIVSSVRDGRKRYKNLTRNYYSVSDLTSPVIIQTKHDEGVTRRSASLTPDCIFGQVFGELNTLQFQSGPTSSIQKRKKAVRSRAKKNRRSKGKRSRKPLRKANNAKVTTSSNNDGSDGSYESFEDSDAYESFEDSDTYVSPTDSQNRHKVFSRNSQSASNLGSLDIQPEDRSRVRSKSLTPNGSYFIDSIDTVQMKFLVKKGEEKDPMIIEKDKKPFPTNPTKEMISSSTTRHDMCPNCDIRSLDGSIASEMDYNGGISRVKRKAEDDVRCMRLLQSELEAERNAATIAANHAMTMITRLQQEKASLQMEALQYLRMMEEQAEYDMEALQKANELVEEKESEIQDLLNELDQYRSKYGDEAMNGIKSFDDEKSHILESLSSLEKRIYKLSNGAHDQSQEKEKHVDLSKLQHDIFDMKEKIEALQADVDLIKHVCNTLHHNEGIDFIQEIANQLQDLRRVMSDRRLISSN